MNWHSLFKALCLTLIFWNFCGFASAQQNADATDATTEEPVGYVYSAHIQDKNSGEPLPYVNIYVSAGIGTMTNIDGDFSIVAEKDAELRISYIGYETLVVKAERLPKTIRLTPVEHTLAEVVVVPVESILSKVEKRLNKEYRGKKAKTSQYFYRQLVSSKISDLSDNDELVEAFVQANSAANLRNLSFLSGRHGRTTAAGLARPLIANMNFHHPLELGPMVKDVNYWRSLVVPLRGGNKESFPMRFQTKPYSYSMETINSDGRKVYRITFEADDKSKNRVVLTGTMNVDATTYELLSYDGKVQGMALDVNKDFVHVSSPIELNIHIKYRNTKKYTEIENLSYSLKSGDVTANALLYNVDGLKLKFGKKAVNKSRVSENMLANIDDAMFDKIMVQNADIVKRTEEETESAENAENKGSNSLVTRYNVKGGKGMKWTLELPDNDLGNHVNRLAKIGQVIPQEKVYVHMDNTSYFLGDSIWFSAYLRRTNDDQLSNISGILYVELINNDGYVMERQMIETKKGYGHGAFHINPDWYAGYYEIRAYTRWQLNWGVTERKHSNESKYWFINKEMQRKYFTDYEKLYSRVFPVYDAPQDAGKYAENMTLRQLVHYFKNDPDAPKLQLKFYPEGGELIYGMPCRVAYEASYSDGMFVKGNLTIDNGKGKEPTVIPTVNRGRGVFTITPTKGMSRNITFTSSNNVKASAALPKIEDEGVAMSVQRNGALWTISINNTDRIPASSLGLTIMHEGRVRYFFEINDSSKVFTISNDDLENGINQATVFDTKGRIYSDRLFFVTRPELTKRALTVTGIKDEYKPYEQVNLEISMDSVALANISNKRDNNSGFISLSVRDSETSNLLFDNASMQAEMLLSSEIRGFVPSPDWFFEKDDTEHQQALDLLMMTQGWRRFDWRKMAIRGEWDLTQPDERTPIITGKLYEYDPAMFYHPKDWSKLLYDDIEQSLDIEDIKLRQSWRAAIEAGNSSASSSSYSDTPTLSATEKTDASTTEVNAMPTNFTYAEHLDQAVSNYNEIHRDLKSHIKPSVRVHAELTEWGKTDVATVETNNSEGKFRIALPKFYNSSIFFLSASDTLGWTASKKYEWVQNMPDYDEIRKFRAKDSELSIRVDQPFPRFVKPYTYYQQNLDFTDDGTMGEKTLDDGTRQLAEVKVKARRRGFRAVNDTLPAFMVDAYEAYNFAMDAGMMTSAPTDILRAYMGDYGLDKPYTASSDYTHEGVLNTISNGINPSSTRQDYRLRVLYGADIVSRILNGKTISLDSVSIRSNLYNNRAIEEQNSRYWDDYYGDLTRIEKYVIYTDFQPRRAGSSRYYGSNLPHSYISIVPYADDSRRKYYRDRRFVFDGIAAPTEFYQPDYSNNRLPSTPDYRRTLYWNPQLPLDANGKASVSFWNNSSATQITVSAEGMGNNGQTIGN